MAINLIGMVPALKPTTWRRYLGCEDVSTAGMPVHVVLKALSEKLKQEAKAAGKSVDEYLRESYPVSVEFSPYPNQWKELFEGEDNGEA